MNVKTQFSIKDLENLSGVKAHTIRIWEKRYDLFNPTRTKTNIRLYDLESLKRLLNVIFLYNDGYKISKIAGLSDLEIQKLIEKKSEVYQEDYALKAFKTAMFDFDELLFTKTYTDLTAHKSFREIFFDVFIPLLFEIGTLWQTGTIEPSHESFISELIKRKIIVNIEQEISSFNKAGNELFILYLPYQEIHEIGLLYTNYEILAAGYKTVYLGANIPVNSLGRVLKVDGKVIFVSYVTMQPEGMEIHDYIDTFQTIIGYDKTNELWLLGNKVQLVDPKRLPSNILVLHGLPGLLNQLENLKKV
jgi:DNA-binding transcriptional MerR regulator